MQYGPVTLLGPRTGDLNVAADETSIYEDGNLTGVYTADLLGNEVGIRQVLNDLNLMKRDNRLLKTQIERLKLEQSGYKLQPYLLVFVAVMNLIGTALVGIGTNLLTGSTVPPYATHIFILGIFIAVLSAAVPPVLPLIIRYNSKEKNADQT